MTNSNPDNHIDLQVVVPRSGGDGIVTHYYDRVTEYVVGPDRLAVDSFNVDGEREITTYASGAWLWVRETVPSPQPTLQFP